MLEKFAFGPRNKPHPSSPTALAHDAQPRQAGGVTYTGAWKDGKPNGKGTYTHADGTMTYTGEWKDGGRNGLGTETLPDGTKRTGEWKDGKLVP